MNRRGFLQALAAVPIVGAMAQPLSKALGDPTPLRMSVSAVGLPSGTRIWLVTHHDDGVTKRTEMLPRNGEWRANVPDGVRSLYVEMQHTVATGAHVVMSLGAR